MRILYLNWRYLSDNVISPILQLIETLRENATSSVDITIGGWGQDGHIAYNQTRRHPIQ